jgi:hypothetical protein
MMLSSRYNEVQQYMQWFLTDRFFPWDIIGPIDLVEYYHANNLVI